MAKRLFDIVLAGLALVILALPMALLALAVRWLLGRPVFFVQERPGHEGRVFKLIKFRTMLNTRGPDGELLPDQERLSRFGQFLRQTSLDELPELWNVLKGEMSLVGPRPLLPQYLPLYSPEQARRHDTRPGITGLAQIRGRNNLPWEERFALDVWYVDNRSLLLDLKIMAETVFAIFQAHGVNKEGFAVGAEPFTGTAPEIGARGTD